MKSPIFHRQDVLDAALRTAVYELKDPVEGLLHTEDGIIAWSKARAIVMEVYSGGSGTREDGAVILGGGGVTARVVRDCGLPTLQRG